MLALLYVVFVLSGAAGLIYESIWTRYLGTVRRPQRVRAGHRPRDLPRRHVAGRAARRTAYRAPEAAALLVRRSSSWRRASSASCSTTSSSPRRSIAYASVFPPIGLGAAQTIVKWGIASLLILPQSILLGMTFPLMSAGVVRRDPAAAGHALAMLYFANSLGAAGGVLRRRVLARRHRRAARARCWRGDDQRRRRRRSSSSR